MRLLLSTLAFACVAAAPALAADLTPGPVPNPGHITLTLPKDIKWEGDEKSGQYQAKLFGDPDKPGIYGVLIKWMPGHFSKPHFHSTDRFIYVISGNWWVSSSDTFDIAKTYPMPAGSFVTDIANTVHWDGAREGDQPTILELVGTGPMVTTRLPQ